MEVVKSCDQHIKKETMKDDKKLKVEYQKTESGGEP